MEDTSEQVVALLNTAQVSTTSAGKVQALKQVEELTVTLQPELLDNFFDVSSLPLSLHHLACWPSRHHHLAQLRCVGAALSSHLANHGRPLWPTVASTVVGPSYSIETAYRFFFVFSFFRLPQPLLLHTHCQLLLYTHRTTHANRKSFNFKTISRQTCANK
jgi:hypothetical protein